jgi:hypothetical protein
MSQCGQWRDKYYDEDGWRWITEAARLRLLLEALILEQEGRIERVGNGYRDRIRDDGTCVGCGARIGSPHNGTCDWEWCGKCKGQRLCCGCDDEEIVALVRELLIAGPTATTSDVSAASADRGAP